MSVPVRFSRRWIAEFTCFPLDKCNIRIALIMIPWHNGTIAEARAARSDPVMWDVRGKSRYYYRHRKVKGRAFRVYVGTGPEAEKIAAQDLHVRMEREYQRWLRNQQQAAFEAAEAPLLELFQSTDLISGAVLVSSGCYQHDHGEWRRRIRGKRKPFACNNH